MLDGISALREFPPVEDCMYTALFEEVKDADMHAMCIQALEFISCGILQILELQCKDHLPGGKFWQLDATTQEAFENVPSTNMIGERDFAILDMLIRKKPNARIASLEAVIMWTNNKTSQWVHSLDDDTRGKLLAEARARSPKLLEKFKARTEKLKREKWNQLQSGEDQKQVSERALLVDGVMKQGWVWKSKERIEEEMAKMEGEEEEIKQCAIYQQFTFCQKILQIKAPRREMYQLSTTTEGKRKVFSSEMKAER